MRLRLTQAAPVRLLAIAMIEPPLSALLVASVGAPPLPAASLLAAIAMSAVTVRADVENRLAALTKAKPLPQNRFAVNHRHASSQAELDNGSGLVAGWNQLCLVYLSMVAEHGTLPLERQGSIFPALRQDTSFSQACG